VFYVKLNGDGSVFRYPYTLTDLIRDNPNVSFPPALTDAEAADFGLYPVQPTAPPPIGHEFDLQRNAALVNGQWVETWEVTPAPPDVIAERVASKASQVRDERDRLLAESDWTQVPDAVNAGADQDAWAAYRQQLRQLPEQASFPWDVIWPEAPEITPPGVILDYRTFYDALLVSPAYGVIRSKAVNSAPVLTACVEFIAAVGDAKAGRPNEAAIQACVDLLCAAAQFSTPELLALAEVMAVGNLDQVYTLPGLS
jgi:hypothetical protein